MLADIDLNALEINGDAMAFATSWLSLSTKIIDDEIAAAAEQAKGARTLRMQSVRQAERWGNHFVK